MSRLLEFRHNLSYLGKISVSNVFIFAALHEELTLSLSLSTYIYIYIYIYINKMNNLSGSAQSIICSADCSNFIQLYTLSNYRHALGNCGINEILITCQFEVKLVRLKKHRLPLNCTDTDISAAAGRLLSVRRVSFVCVSLLLLLWF